MLAGKLTLKYCSCQTQCGVPKKGHVCPYQPKLKRRPDEPPPELRNAAIQVEMDEVSHCVERRVKLFTLQRILLHFLITLHFLPCYQFMTLRRLNLKIQGFPESYATEPYAGEGMVVGEPHQSPSMSPQNMSRGMPLGGGDPNLRPQPEHDSSMGIRGSPPTPSSASPLRSPPNMPNGLSPRGSPPRVRPESSPRGSPASIHSVNHSAGAGPRGSPARSVHSASSNRRSPPPMQGIPMQTMTSPRGSPPPMNGIPLQAMASPRGSPPQMRNGASPPPLGSPLTMPRNGSSPRGSPQPMSPPPMNNRSSPRGSPKGSPRGSPPLTHDASTGDGLLQQADSVTKV
jgi:hypothetical protein